MKNLVKTHDISTRTYSVATPSGDRPLFLPSQARTTKGHLTWPLPISSTIHTPYYNYYSSI